METVRDFIFLGSKITAEGDCSHEIKRCLLPGRKAMTNLDSVLKSRDITFLTKVHTVKAMVSLVVMYGCVSWTIKKTERQRTDVFLTVVLENTLESPLDCKGIKPVNLKGNQSWVCIGRTDTEAEAPILWPLKSQWSSNPLASEEPTHWKKFWCWERLRAGEGGNSGWDGLMGSSTQQTWVWARVWGYSKGQQSLACCSPWGRKETDMTK